MTKQEYLTQVAEWKQSYASITVDIRSAKQDYREKMSAYGKIGKCETLQERTVRARAWTTMLTALNHRDLLRKQATELLTTRAEMKVEAQRAYQSSRT